MHFAFRITVCFLAFAGMGHLSASDQIPGKPQENPIAIKNAVIHVTGGEVIYSGTLVFDQGKITAVGKTVDLADGTEVIDADGKHVYASLIDAYSDLGLVEINSVRASLDGREVGDFNPNVRAAAAFNPDSELIPVNRANGLLLSISAPSGGRIAGRSSLMMLDGWTWEDMELQSDVGMHCRWSTSSSAKEALTAFVEQAIRFSQIPESSRERDLRLQAMLPVVEGDMPLIVDASSLTAIRESIAFAERYGLRLIIHGGADAAHCSDLLKRAKVPVIVSSVYRNPSRRNEPYDGPYSLPARLEEAGVQFCISAGGRFGASGIRNLPYHAATAAAYGLDPQTALDAITTRPAEILGVADRVGALKPGMDATLFVADGDILETESQVEHAFIQGRKVDLDNKHRQLYRKYSEKYAD